MRNKNRVKLVLVSQEFLIKLFRQGTDIRFKVLSDGLPKDSFIERMDYDPGTSSYFLTVHSSTYPEVPEGAYLERIRPLISISR